MLPIPSTTVSSCGKGQIPSPAGSHKGSTSSLSKPNKLPPPRFVEISQSTNCTDSAQHVSIKDLLKDPIKLGQY